MDELPKKRRGPLLWLYDIRRNSSAGWVAAGVVALLLIIACLPVFQEALWIGSARRTLSFSVNDAESGTPVAGAEITIFVGLPERPLSAPPPTPDPSIAGTEELSTADDGRAQVLYRFEAYGRRGTFIDEGRVRFWDRCIRVTAAGYDPVQFNLGEWIGGERDIHDESVIKVSVELKRARASEAEPIE